MTGMGRLTHLGKQGLLPGEFYANRFDTDETPGPSILRPARGSFKMEKRRDAKERARMPRNTSSHPGFDADIKSGCFPDKRASLSPGIHRRCNRSRCVKRCLFMNKKSKDKAGDPNVPVTKQTAGAVTGAVVGSMIAGPVGAIVGGVAGAMMGKRVEEGKSAIPEGAMATAESMAKKAQRSAGARKVKALAKKAVANAKSSGKAVFKKVAARTSPVKSGPKSKKKKVKARRMRH